MISRFITVSFFVVLMAGQWACGGTEAPSACGECDAPPTAEEVAKALLNLPEFKALMKSASPAEGGDNAPASTEVRSPEEFAACVAGLRTPGKINVNAARGFRRIHACAKPPKPPTPRK